MKVVLNSILAEANMEAPPKSLFSDLFSKVCHNLDLKETWYFGLCYKPEKATDLIWLDASKKVLKKLPHAAKNLMFRIKFHPEDVGEELLENTTAQIFYLETKKAILSSEIYCPADIAALLASYSLQVEFGDYSEEKQKIYLISNKDFLPRRILKLYNVGLPTWTESIVNMWKNLKDLDPEDAMLEYLKLAQNLDMFGVTYFSIQNKKKTRLLLGVTALGLNIYTNGDRLTPQLSFSWSEIKKMRFTGKKFLIKFTGKKIPDFVCYTLSKSKSKQIYNLGLGNHELYITRRKPDTPEMKMLKEKACILKTLKQKTKEKLKLNISAHEDSLRREEGYQKHLQKLQQDLEFTMKKIHQEIEEKLEETKRLQKEIETAKQKEDEYRLRQRKAEEHQLRMKAKMEESRREEDILFLSKESNYKPLPEFMDVNDELHGHMKSLREKLEGFMKEGEDTAVDRLYLDNVKEEREKYKTLSEIGGVDCNKRIKLFHKM